MAKRAPFLVDGVPHLGGVGIGLTLAGKEVSVLAPDRRALRAFFRANFPNVPYEKANEKTFVLAKSATK